MTNNSVASLYVLLMTDDDLRGEDKESIDDPSRRVDDEIRSFESSTAVADIDIFRPMAERKTRLRQ